MQRLEKFFGEENIAYDYYSTKIMPLKGTITYRYYRFEDGIWKETLFTTVASEKNHEVRFIFNLGKWDFEKCKVQNKIYTKQELIKELETQIELIEITEEEMKDHYFFVDGKKVFFKDLVNKEFSDYYKSVQSLRRNNHPAYIFQKYLKDKKIAFNNTKELVELWNEHKIDYNKELNKKL